MLGMPIFNSHSQKRNRKDADLLHQWSQVSCRWRLKLPNRISSWWVYNYLQAQENHECSFDMILNNIETPILIERWNSKNRKFSQCWKPPHPNNSRPISLNATSAHKDSTIPPTNPLIRKPSSPKNHPHPHSAKSPPNTLLTGLEDQTNDLPTNINPGKNN